MGALKQPTYADLEKVPPHRVAELIEGALVTQPRPRPRHAIASSRLGVALGGSFDFDSGGPGGWVFMTEPELHFGANVVVPDIAGWRRERLLQLPDTAYLEVAPDWVCEVLSPSTAMYDKGPKRRIYAEAGISYLWLLEPEEQVLEAFQIVSGQWLLAGTAAGNEDVRLAPFDAISFPLANLFPFDTPKDPNNPEG